VGTPRRRAVIGVVAGGEHLRRVDRDRHRAALRPLAHLPQLGAGRLEDEDRLNEEREVADVVRVAVVLSDRFGSGRGGDAADQERGDVEPLPDGEVVAHDERDLGVEVSHSHGCGPYRVSGCGG
jgi:hypothetical protein